MGVLVSNVGMSHPHDWLTLGGILNAQVEMLDVGVLVNNVGMSHPHDWLTLGGVPTAQVETLEVGVLVNNVGMSYPHAEYYDAVDDQLIDDLITLNIVSTNKARCSCLGSLRLIAARFPMLRVRT